ncbi:MAG: hypothetical protein WD468_11870 [Pirellulales bacterium]
MRHAEIETDQMPGQDSFLDVITNIVGILILLVLVVGARTSRSVSQATGVDIHNAVTEEELATAVRAAMSAQHDVSELVKRSVNVHSEVLIKDREREYLGTYVAAGEQEMAELRSQLSHQQQRDFDLRNRLSTAQQSLDELTRQQIALVSETPEVEAVTSLPTPLAETVTGKEIHLRLAEGNVSVIPLEELLKNFKQDAEDNSWRLRDRDSFVATVGPVEGYELRYRLQKQPFALQSASGLEQHGTAVRLVKWELVPALAQIGEPVDQSLSSNGDLRRCLARNSPTGTTITIWTYPESFSDFRKLKKALFDLGYATAARPLPQGILIGGSPNGSRSAAQ